MNPWLIQAGASLLWLGGTYLWRKLSEQEPARQRPEAVALPRSDEGATIPFVCGRYRVRSPIIAYDGKQFAIHRPDEGEFLGGNADLEPERYIYLKNIHFVAGIPMSNGEGTSRVHAMWLGTAKIGAQGTAPADDLTGNGNFETRTVGRPFWDSLYVPDRPFNSAEERDDASKGLYPFQAEVEFLNGNPNQKLLDDDDSPLTFLGKHMTVTTSDQAESYRNYSGTIPPEQVPSYRGLLSVFLHHDGGDEGSLRQYAILGGPSLDAPSFELSDYTTNHPQLGTYARVGLESNPVNVIVAILTHPKMMGLAESKLDMASFQSAQYTLHTETHGYSCSFEGGPTAEEMLGDVLRQIHGVLFVDRKTDKIKIKLLRNDYDPTTIPVIDKSNADKVEIESISEDDVPNKIRVTFRNRSKGYETDSVTAQDLASVYASGKTREEVIDYPGVCTPEQAQRLADRDLADIARPVMTASAIVGRMFRNLEPGDPIKLVWQRPDVAGVVMRVVDISYGTISDAAIRLSLVEDSAYVWSNQNPLPPDFGGFPTPPAPVNGF